MSTYGIYDSADGDGYSSIHTHQHAVKQRQRLRPAIQALFRLMLGHEATITDPDPQSKEHQGHTGTIVRVRIDTISKSMVLLVLDMGETTIAVEPEEITLGADRSFTDPVTVERDDLDRYVEALQRYHDRILELEDVLRHVEGQLSGTIEDHDLSISVEQRVRYPTHKIRATLADQSYAEETPTLEIEGYRPSPAGDDRDDRDV
jgi:hypothetical protein